MAPNQLAPVVISLIYELRDERIAHAATRDVLRESLSVLHREHAENKRVKSRYYTLLDEARDVRARDTRAAVA